jgi:hypothetical protein
MSTSRNNLPAVANPRPGTRLAPVAFAHRTAPVAFMGRPPTTVGLDEGPTLRFAGRITRSTRFPVEAAIAMNDPRSRRLGHHVDMHC